MRPPSPASLRSALSRAGDVGGRTMSDPKRSVAFASLETGSNLSCPPAALAGRSVLIATQAQFPAALSLIALDGLAQRLVLAPPDLPQASLGTILRDAEIDTVVTDAAAHATSDFAGLDVVIADDRLVPIDPMPDDAVATEWVLATSGTTGAPKLVVHTLEGLAGAIEPVVDAAATVWGTFYDIRRYGGLQIFLRAVLGPSSLILSDADEAVGTFLDRLGRAGATHILGTPSHWRRALMSPRLSGLAPRYVRLSGEIADQAILDQLKRAFPEAHVAHAYASTEAGVGFSVDDGRAGFPADLVGARPGIEIRVRDEILQVRSVRTGRRYLGADAADLADSEGFVDTGDRVAVHEGRYVFLGRRSGLINVGGAKVQPEEVEAVLNRHPGVSMARVRGRPNPILGSLVVADIALHGRLPEGDDAAALSAELLALCRRELPAYKVPARLVFVETLPLTASGKLARGMP
ncbi:ANL family adenylate-forming protein [Methylobacterium sp. J-070]|uniref:ANL family adenylate-forming protein n=1 Tax=Methylobacterium sp. J-070 TaxID=2836650 RepID=UPI00391A8406